MYSFLFPRIEAFGGGPFSAHPIEAPSTLSERLSRKECKHSQLGRYIKRSHVEIIRAVFQMFDHKNTSGVE